MNIFKHEMRLYFKTTLAWNFWLVMVLVVFASIYPMFLNSIEIVEKILSSFPEYLMQAFGLDLMSFSSAIGFFGFLFTYIILIGGIQAMTLGLSLLSNEQRDKTADFLYTKPVKRSSIIHSKVLVGLCYIIITNIIFSVSAIITLNIISENGYSIVLLMLLLGSLFLTQLFFLSLGLMVSVFMNKLKTVVPISLGTVFLLFILNMLNESIQGKPLTFLTPFAYFHVGRLYSNMSYDLKWLLLNSCLIIVFIGVSYYKQIKKDLPTV